MEFKVTRRPVKIKAFNNEALKNATMLRFERLLDNLNAVVHKALIDEYSDRDETLNESSILITRDMTDVFVSADRKKKVSDAAFSYCLAWADDKFTHQLLFENTYRATAANSAGFNWFRRPYNCSSNVSYPAVNDHSVGPALKVNSVGPFVCFGVNIFPFNPADLSVETDALEYSGFFPALHEHGVNFDLRLVCPSFGDFYECGVLALNTENINGFADPKNPLGTEEQVVRGILSDLFQFDKLVLSYPKAVENIREMVMDTMTNL